MRLSCQIVLIEQREPFLRIVGDGEVEDGIPLIPALGMFSLDDVDVARLAQLVRRIIGDVNLFLAATPLVWLSQGSSCLAQQGMDGE